MSIGDERKATSQVNTQQVKYKRVYFIEIGLGLSPSYPEGTRALRDFDPLNDCRILLAFN